MTTYNFTLSELHQIKQAGGDIHEVAESLNDQPEWLLAMGGINDLAELQAIYQGGCASGAFMPACTYYTANAVMSQFGDDVLEFIEVFAAIPDIDGCSWFGFASKVLSVAVEAWVSMRVSDHHLDDIEAS